MSVDVKDFIEHYGTKGMKWGVRKAPDPRRSASNWKARKDKERADKEKAKKSGVASKPPTTKKPVPAQARASAKKMTDEELRAAVSRLQLEKQFVELSSQPKQLTKGEAFVKASKEVAADVAKKQAKNVANTLVKRELEKAFGIKIEGDKKGKKKDKPNPIVTSWKPRG